MSLSISVTKDVTTLSVTDTETSLTISPVTTTIGVANVAISQSNTASGINYTPTGHIASTTVQAALDEIAASPEFTAALNTKLGNIEESADVTDTENVVGALTAGDNISIGENGTVSADVLGAITAGNGIDIDVNGVISVDDIAIATVQTAANETEHLALTTQQGDVVIRTDENKSYIHNGGTAGTMADFTELATNTNGVLSINDATGAVTFGKADLSDYSANEFIDWSTSQTENIHADNYTNTTYSAGTGINISETNEISATGGTGGTGGTSFTAIGNLELNDSNELDTVASPIFDDVRFTATDGTYSGVYIKSFPSETFEQYGPGLGIYFESGESTQLIGAVLENTLSTFGEFNAVGGLKIQGSRFAHNKQGWADYGGNAKVPISVHNTETNVSTSFSPSDPDYSTYNYIDHFQYGGNRHSVFLDPTASIYMANQYRADSGLSQDDSGAYNIANKKYVDDTVTALGVPNIQPTQNATYIQSENGAFTASALDLVTGFVDEFTNENEVRIAIFDRHTEDTMIGGKIIGGSGVTVSLGTNEITISANPDGLPDQSLATDGYVLTSDGTDASWADLSVASLPSQDGNSGKFLTTNNGSASWADIDAYPTQTGNGGKVLTTNGTLVSWQDVDALPEQDSDTYGKFLISADTGAYWSITPETLPDQQYASGKYLTSNGSSLSWAEVNTAGQTGDITFSNNTISSSSNDVVNIDDNLDVDGTVTGEQFQANGAGTPEINSVSTFNINAPSGVFANNKEVEATLYTGIISVGTDLSTVSSDDFTVAKRTHNTKPYIEVSLADSTLTHPEFHAEASYVYTSSVPNFNPANVICTKTLGKVLLSITDSDGNVDVTQCKIRLKIYAT